MYLLDTTHCIRILSKDRNIEGKIKAISGIHITTCVTVVGELMYGAYKSDRVDENLRSIVELLKDMYAIYRTDIETARIYGNLKAEILNRFGPKDKAKRRIAKIERLGFRENDLWIAAIAIQNGLIIISGDSDFHRLNGIFGLKIESW